MELVKVAIKNFQSIKDEEVIKINNTITTIVGLNESGKSTLLKAIEKLNGSQIEKKEKNKEILKSLFEYFCSIVLEKVDKNYVRTIHR